MYPWNHHYNQDTEHIITSKVPCYPFVISSVHPLMPPTHNSWPAVIIFLLHFLWFYIDSHTTCFLAYFTHHNHLEIASLSHISVAGSFIFLEYLLHHVAISQLVIYSVDRHRSLELNLLSWPFVHVSDN